jgi:hypothetical protein
VLLVYLAYVRVDSMKLLLHIHTEVLPSQSDTNSWANTTPGTYELRKC